jgi:DNA adenine methylase
MQQTLFDNVAPTVSPFKSQLLKWIGNKQRFAHEIATYFPQKFGTYFEPFLGSGGVLGALAPLRGVASDNFAPLIEIWQTLRSDPRKLAEWYSERQAKVAAGDKRQVYEDTKASYNARPNGADLLFLCRSCYGGVVRFRKADGYMSTPCGVHDPISAESFAKRAAEWHRRVQGVTFLLMDYKEAMQMPRAGDLVYCDPPYSHSQSILYGAQEFSLADLFKEIAACKARGVYVALSIDGKKRSGTHLCEIHIPDELFEREVFVNCGRSMLRRFQMQGDTLEGEVVADRLLLTY